MRPRPSGRVLPDIEYRYLIFDLWLSTLTLEVRGTGGLAVG
jgi:hypothetical protein